MMQLFEQLKQRPVIYVTRDIERALGLPADTEGYHIIANSTPFAKGLLDTRSDLFLVEEEGLLDTWDLLKHPAVIDYINGFDDVALVVFKNTKQIEQTCADNEWTLLNPPAAISDIVEPKISQVEWLGELDTYLPPRRVSVCSDVYWDNTPFILQFNRSHTGSGTMLIESEEQLKEIQDRFPNRPVRLSEYIHGPLVTNNNCVTADAVLIGNISYQITGLEPFTDRPFATIGNDWALPHTMLSQEQKTSYIDMATAVGNKLRAAGWRGLFGIDVVIDEHSGELFLLEINCRQPASTTFESYLQRSTSTEGQTTFEAHLSALLDINTDSPLIKLTDGAQVILRNTDQGTWSAQQLLQMEEILEEKNFIVTEYENTKPGSDLLRIQSMQGLMADHNTFNSYGKMIARVLSSRAE